MPADFLCTFPSFPTLRELLTRGAELAPQPTFVETIPGVLVAESDLLPLESLDLEEVLAQAEGRAP